MAERGDASGPAKPDELAGTTDSTATEPAVVQLPIDDSSPRSSMVHDGDKDVDDLDGRSMVAQKSHEGTPLADRVDEKEVPVAEEPVEMPSNSCTYLLKMLSPYVQEPLCTTCHTGIFQGQDYKPGFRNLHKGVQLGIALLMFTAIVILPVWLLAPIQDDHFVSPDCGICTETHGPWMQSGSTNFPVARQTEAEICGGELFQNATDAGWTITPFQGHLHRYGLIYQAVLFTHIILGTWLVFVAAVCWLVTLPCLSPRPGTAGRLFVECLHYWGFLWGWILNMIVSLVLSYTRVLTLGPDPANYNYSFSAAFYYDFYFIVLIMLLALQLSFHDVQTPQSVISIFFQQFARLGCMTVSLNGLIVAVIITANSELVMSTSMPFPTSDYDKAVLQAISVFIIVPIINSLVLAGYRTNFVRVTAAHTKYYISVLILGINLTYRFEQTYTVYVALFLSAAYVLQMIWSYVEISRAANTKESFAELLLRGSENTQLW
eukprot:TRINITY_DN15226_c0_g1_i1.p1 TRINITY_DN15226_c0_g1~~TRINITY_DN15226_c0_g1_i1.p1  ORF type:complete len:490 (+),score=83.09 TRINITY_DN15226_c0_g1_i1:65-1534(+)